VGLSTFGTMTSVALYARLSQADESSNSIASQLSTLRALADREGYTIYGEYVDDGISGFSGKTRPGFQGLLVAMTDGKVELVLARHQDRLSRNDEDLWQLRIASAKHKVRWQMGDGSITDPGTAQGGLTATITGAIAGYESMLKTERLRAHYAAEKAAGKLLPANRPFGYNPDKLTLHPTEAPAAQAAYRRIMEGGSIYSVVKEWNAAGIKPSRGNRWTTQILRAYLLRPGNAGLVREAGGWLEGVTAVWEPLVSVEDFKAVHGILTDPQRRVTPGPKQSHLMGGIVQCTVCGHVMRSAAKSVKGKPNIPVYKCTNPDRSQGSHVVIPTANVDPLVVDSIAQAFMFGAEALPEATVDLAPLEAVLTDVRQRYQALSGLVRMGMPLEQAALDLDGLRKEEQAAVEALSEARGSIVGGTLTSDALSLFDHETHRVDMDAWVARRRALREGFLALPLDQQRELVRMQLEVAVSPGRSKDRVHVRWLRVDSLNESPYELDPDPSEPYKSGEDVATEQS
jgi:site-specific DNA recombinase